MTPVRPFWPFYYLREIIIVFIGYTYRVYIITYKESEKYPKGLIGLTHWAF